MLLYDWYITIIVELSTITSWCYISILVFIFLWKNISNFPWMITSESMIPRFNNYIYYLFVWFTHAYHSTPYSLTILLLEQQLYIDIKWRKKQCKTKRQMSSVSLCSMIWGEWWLLALYILVESSVITV